MQEVYFTVKLRLLVLASAVVLLERDNSSSSRSWLNYPICALLKVKSLAQVLKSSKGEELSPSVIVKINDGLWFQI